MFCLATLRDLPDIERMEIEGLLKRPQPEIDLDGALGLAGDDDQTLEGDFDSDETEFEDTAEEI